MKEAALVPRSLLSSDPIPPLAELRRLPLLTLFVLPESSDKSMTNKQIFSFAQGFKPS